MIYWKMNLIGTWRAYKLNISTSVLSLILGNLPWQSLSNFPHHHQLLLIMTPKTALPFTYDHRLRRNGHPVRSAIHKPQIGRLVVGWVTTSEYLLLYVFGLFSFDSALSEIEVERGYSELVEAFRRTLVRFLLGD
jgi:hypothetical protein